jgi:hypothetical protein
MITKKENLILNLKSIAILIVVFFSMLSYAQVDSTTVKPKSEFWKKVTFMPSIGLGFSNGGTNISLAPAAVYNVNKYYSIGMGLQYSYFKQRDSFSSNTYGASAIILANPIDQFQLSAELEQLRANVKSEVSGLKNDFWNTAFFLGAGYRVGNSVIGARYNVLFKKDDGVYGDAFMPFVRIGF